MRKIFIISFFLLVCLALSAPVVFASAPCTNAPSDTLCNPVRFTDDAVVFVFKLVSISASFFGLVTVIFVVFSGLRMITSQGDAEEITAAKNALMWSIFGLILSMFAFVIIFATGQFIGAKDLDPNSYVGNNIVRNPLLDDTFLALLTRLLLGFLTIVGILAVLMIVLGGFRYVTSRGDDEQSESGKKTMQWAILGLVTTLLAYVLVRSNLTFFGG